MAGRGKLASPRGKGKLTKFEMLKAAEARGEEEEEDAILSSEESSEDDSTDDEGERRRPESSRSDGDAKPSARSSKASRAVADFDDAEIERKIKFLDKEIKKTPSPTAQYPNVKAVFALDNEDLKDMYLVARFLATGAVAEKSEEEVRRTAAELDEETTEKLKVAYDAAKEKYQAANKAATEKKEAWNKSNPELAEMLAERKRLKRARTMNKRRMLKLGGGLSTSTAITIPERTSVETQNLISYVFRAQRDEMRMSQQRAEFYVKALLNPSVLNDLDLDHDVDVELPARKRLCNA